MDIYEQFFMQFRILHAVSISLGRGWIYAVLQCAAESGGLSLIVIAESVLQWHWCDFQKNGSVS
jgi:hypothetical protein